MKNKEVVLLWRYIINNLTALEQEVQQLQQNLRYRKIDTVDCHELALAIDWLNTFQKVSNDILLLLRMDKSTSEKFDKFEASELDKLL